MSLTRPPSPDVIGDNIRVTPSGRGLSFGAFDSLPAALGASGAVVTTNMQLCVGSSGALRLWDERFGCDAAGRVSVAIPGKREHPLVAPAASPEIGVVALGLPPGVGKTALMMSAGVKVLDAADRDQNAEMASGIFYAPAIGLDEWEFQSPVVAPVEPEEWEDEPASGWLLLSDLNVKGGGLMRRRPRPKTPQDR